MQSVILGYIELFAIPFALSLSQPMPIPRKLYRLIIRILWKYVFALKFTFLLFRVTATLLWPDLTIASSDKVNESSQVCSYEPTNPFKFTWTESVAAYEMPTLYLENYPGSLSETIWTGSHSAH